MSETDALFGELRSLLAQPASYNLWRALCAHLDTWPADAMAAVAVPYAIDHLARWPDAQVREAPHAWVLALRGGRDEPRLALCNKLDLGSDAGDAGARKVARCAYLSGLTHLELKFARIKDAGVRALARSPHLTQLHTINLSSQYSKKPLGPAAMAELARFPALRDLSLGSNGLDDATLASLIASMPSLTRLGLSDNALTMASVGPMLAHPALDQLGCLSLARQELGAPLADALIGASGAGRLELLFLDGCALGDEGFAALIQSAAVANLRDLDVEDNGITDVGMRALADSLHLTRLGSLRLNSNAIGPAGMEALCAAHMPALTALYVEGCDLNDDAARLIAASPLMGQLTHLFFLNRVTDAGIAALRAVQRPGQYISLPEKGW